MSKRSAPEHFYFYILDHDRCEVCVEGPMTDDTKWHDAIKMARSKKRDVTGSPYDGIDGRSNREKIASECERQFGYKIVAPGSIVDQVYF